MWPWNVGSKTLYVHIKRYKRLFCSQQIDILINMINFKFIEPFILYDFFIRKTNNRIWTSYSPLVKLKRVAGIGVSARTARCSAP